MVEAVQSVRGPQVTASRQGAVVSIKPQQNSGFKWKLMAAAMAVSMVPVIGPGIGHIIDRHRHNAQANEAKETLAKGWYRDQIAAQLGIPPEKVNAKALERAAAVNPTFRALIEHVETQRDRSNRASLAGAAIATPFSVAGLGAPVSLAAKAAEVGVSMAAGTAISLIGKDYLTVDDVSTYVNQKRVAGGAITAEDVFYLKLAHDRSLQDAIKAQHGTAFHKMKPAQQEGILRALPDHYYAHATQMAQSVNEGRMSEQQLTIAASGDLASTMAVLGPRAGTWAARVGGPRPAQRTGFAEQVLASRAAAPQGFVKA